MVCSRTTGSRRAAFTLVELLVVITIIGMLMALLLPAVNSAREAARRVDCANRERQVAQAAQLYQADLGSFPGYWMATSASNANGVTWPLMLSKYMGRQDIWNTWVNASNGSTTANAQTVFGTLYYDQMVCPSNPPLTNQGQWQSYVVNCGLITNNTKPGDGVCFNQLANQTPAPPKTSTDSLQVGKGDSYTLFNSENTLGIVSNNTNAGWAQTTASGAVQYTGFCWVATASPNAAQQVNGDKANASPPMSGAQLTDYARPASNHPGGANVTFCDTHYHFLRQDVPYYVYQMLMCANPAISDIPSGAIPSGYVLSDGDY
jgi:prepilin-type N-terminal cleavage/methylation domain-containing protein/prepilin-type processing-associated H-X9-DG protein